MALQERVFGLETEYAINFYPTNATDAKPGAQTIVNALHDILVQQCGVSGSLFLVTGAKFHHDVGHAEWAQPECRSARELATYDKAADHLLAQILPQAQEKLQQQGHQGQLLIAKNNADFVGNTYGCHENYLMLRDTELLTDEHFLRYLARCLIPFLVTRQLFAGSGRLVSGSQRLGYEISQRAAFMNTIVSAETTKERPIFNTGRESEPLADGNYRRLHLIMGDANLSGWATWMKLGTTGIILRMIEDMFIVDMPLLQDPLDALRAIARDTSVRQLQTLRDGRRMSALDIQSFYYERADAYLAEFGCSDEEDALMDAWEQTLRDLGDDPMKLRNRVDWAMKKRFLDTYLRRANVSWEDAAHDRAFLNSLQAHDLRFHDISREGLFNQFFYPDTIVTAPEIQSAQQQPPPYTRARIRGTAIQLARQYSIAVKVEKWAELSLAGKMINLPDPLEFDSLDLPASSKTLRHRLETACEEQPDDAYKHNQLGIFYGQEGFYEQALQVYQKAVRLQPQERIYLQNLAGVLRKLGRYQEAIDCYKQSHRLTDNKKLLDFTNIGEVYRYLGRYDDAIKVYQYDIQVNPETEGGTFAQENIGQVLLKLGRIDAAEAQFERTLAKAHAHLFISPVALGVIHLWRGKADQAQKMLQAALVFQEQEIRGITREAIRYFWAIAHIALGDEQGLALLEEALKRRDPPAAEGLFLLTPLMRLLAQAPVPPANIQQALELIRRAEDTPPQTEVRPQNQLSQQELAWLRTISTHQDRHIRGRAAKYLGWRKSDESIAFLQQMVLHDESVPVRLAAVQALGELASTAATDILLTCLGNAIPSVRWAAQETLEEMNRDIPPIPPAPPPAPLMPPPDSDNGEQLIQLIS